MMADSSRLLHATAQCAFGMRNPEMSFAEFNKKTVLLLMQPLAQMIGRSLSPVETIGLISGRCRQRLNQLF